MKQRSYSAPAIIVLLAILPLLYVGSYFALVIPRGRLVFYPAVGRDRQFISGISERSHYRIGRRAPAVLFWPLEKLHRKLRPQAWEAMQ